MLAWLVADARGATVPLDKALAETVGKRLDRQAQKVRDNCIAARERAVQLRTDARAAAAADPSLAAGLPDQTAAIDEEERLALSHPLHEIYVGFHELEGLMPSTDGSAPEVASAALPSTAPIAAPAATSAATPVAAPAAAPTTTPTVPPPAADMAERYDLACKLHQELVATREELRIAKAELAAEVLSSRREFDEGLRVSCMLQRALNHAAAELQVARKRLRDPEEDSEYLEILFADRSFIDEDQWREHRQMLRRLWDEREANSPTEIFHDLAREGWNELVERARDPIRCEV